MPSFKTILVPVDFSINTEVAIYKALELSDNDGSHIHLLHVTRQLGTAGVQRSRESAMVRMTQWKTSLEENNGSLNVFVWIVNSGSVQRVIERMAIKLKAGLVIIGKQRTHNWFSFFHKADPAKIAQHTQSAVLTVKPGALRSKTKIVVVPVSGDLPGQKMQALAAVCRRCRVRIHLVAFASGGSTDLSTASTLLQLYQWLRNDLHCPVEHAVLYGSNKARTLLAYAKKMDADVLLLNPETETRIGWPNRQLSDMLPEASKMQVLTVGSSFRLRE